MTSITSSAVAGLVLFAACPALAQEARLDAPSGADRANDSTADVKLDAPQPGFSLSAFGVHEAGVGAQATGGAFGTAPSTAEPLFGGLAYGSPTDRLTLMGGADRTFNGKFAPSATVGFRLLGSVHDGYALSALARYRTEGFDEVGGEMETGALLSVSQDNFHLDTNAIVGFGLEEEEGGEGEVDGELKLRLGYDVATWLRLGVDSQLRARLNGEAVAPGGRTWDAAGGPQVLGSWDRFYVGATGGPSTMGVEGTGVGWFSFLTLGGVSP